MDALHTESIERLIKEFQNLPGVGRRSAERYAYYLLKASNETAMNMAIAIRDVKKNIRNCSRCFNISESELCPVCINAKRNPNLICVVEFPKDLFSIEKSSRFDGQYHVLLGHISPLDNVTEQDIKISELYHRLTHEPIEEVILATNPTVEGDTTAMTIARHVNKTFPGIRVTRLARGIPAGAEIEFASKAILSEALSRRQPLQEN